MFIADFHIHSKYSRATSPKTDLEHLSEFAKIKGIDILATGDFTHPEWLKEIKDKLEPAEQGLYKLKSAKEPTRFILSSEISCIYSKAGSVRKVHIVVLAPSIEIVEKINLELAKIGNLKADGRPILGLDAKKLAEIVLNVSQDCLIIPAHCLLPDTFLHTNSGIKMIKDIVVGDKVYTHKGVLRKVSHTFNREYQGKVYNIKPYYFSLGLQTTSEHPFYAIKTKWCPNMSHTICKKDCAYIKSKNCSHKYFENYHPEWVQVKDIKKGNIVIFPRFNEKTIDKNELDISKFINSSKYKLDGKYIFLDHSRAKKIPKLIKIDKNFCRLIGYYISEGYTDNRDSISFCFARHEEKYIKDLEFLMKKVFNLSSPRIYKRENSNGVEIIYFSKILAKVFSKLFYNNSNTRRAHTKCLPLWMLSLPIEKQVEVFRGWWRGDAGVTVSRDLMNQMKIVLLRLGIIPSISIQTKEYFNNRPSHKHTIGDRVIRAQHDSFSFHNLSFFQDLFGLLEDPCLEKFKTKINRRHGWIDEKYVYLPVRDIEIKNYKGKVYNLEVEKDNSYLSEFATVHNCMTPWFGVFGSKSGFDSLEECFEDYTKYIYAMETGLSADPAMLWRLPDGRRTTLLSNSDAHSPGKLGREANVFEGKDISYNALSSAIKNSARPGLAQFLKLAYTIEFFPQEGKYHFDGHRECDVSLSPEESKKYNNLCPSCGKPLTIGVMNRIDKLADKPEGFKPENAVPFKCLVPLLEIIGEALDVGPASKRVAEQYNNLIEKVGTEFHILLDAKQEDMAKASTPEIAEGIIRVREGKVNVEPGYDGVFGKVRIFSKVEKKNFIKQKVLF